MKVIIEHRYKNELSQKEIQRLNQLHLKFGLMWGHFQTNDDCEVILATHKDRIIGWGLILFDKEKNTHEFHVYVSKYNRRFGIGTQIFKYASDLYPEGLWVSKWSEEAAFFYDNFDILEEDIDEEDSKLD